MTTDDQSMFARPPSEVEDSLQLGGMGVVFKVSGEDTGGAFEIVEHPVAPGTLIPPHTHTREDEYSFVISGVIGARIGDEEVTAGPGAYLIKPRGIPHSFWNAGPESARILEMISPPGFSKFFRELHAEIDPADPDAAKIAEIGVRYGLTYLPEWIPELMEKYGLNPPV
jgi:quercetin dioxygenase-like cupin family protein